MESLQIRKSTPQLMVEARDITEVGDSIDAHREPPFWQGHHLVPRIGNRDEYPGPRVRKAGQFARWFGIGAPQAKLISTFGTFRPEEYSLMTVIVESRFSSYVDRSGRRF